MPAPEPERALDLQDVLVVAVVDLLEAVAEMQRRTVRSGDRPRGVDGPAERARVDDVDRLKGELLRQRARLLAADVVEWHVTPAAVAKPAVGGPPMAHQVEATGRHRH